jgi:hypothetical protein
VCGGKARERCLVVSYLAARFLVIREIKDPPPFPLSVFQHTTDLFRVVMLIMIESAYADMSGLVN